MLDAPEDKQSEVVRLVSAFLRSAKIDRVDEPGYQSIYVLSTIGNRGERALPYLDVIAEVLKEPSRDSRIRWEAAKAVLNIEGVDKAIERYKVLDDVGIKVAVWTLSKYFAQTDTTRRRPMTEEELTTRRKARELALRAIRSEDRETARAAVQGLLVFFGDEVVVQRTGGYQMHPDFVAATEYYLERDPEKVAQNALQEFRDHMDEMAQNILRSRR